MTHSKFPQQVVKQGFIWCLAAVYLFAFTSLYVQIPGLYGKNGLLPASYVLHDLSTCVDKHSSCSMWASVGECHRNNKWMTSHCMKTCNNCQAFDTSFSGLFKKTPTLLWVTPYLGLDTSSGMELLCVVGIILSMVLLVSQRCRDFVSFLLLWFLYYSMVQVGQKFLWYQWDGLLWETGFLAIIIAPWNISLVPWRWIICRCKCFRNMARHHDALTLWLVKWLLFRLMFASGVVKLSFMDPTWWNMTAMYWHYESQCIPTPVAWYFQKLPKWFHRLSVVITYIIEIGLPFLFFVPIRAIRVFAYSGQVVLQLLIILTGNYNFFNLLTIILCISLLDDKCITSRVKCSCSPCTKSCRKNKESESNSKGEGSESKKDDLDNDKPAPDTKQTRKGETSIALQLVDKLIDWINSKLQNKILIMVKDFLHSKLAIRLHTAAIIASCIVTFIGSCVLVSKWFWFEIDNGGIYSWIAFSPDDFRRAVTKATLIVIWIALVSLVVEIIQAVIRCLLEQTSRRRKVWSLFQCTAFSLIALWMFAVSLDPLTDLSARAKYSLPSVFRKWYKDTKFLEIAHPYGLFRSMTGIGGRPEIIILGSDSMMGPWKEYNFLYKPGNIYAPPPFVAPHQPRLDWQMWFAALESYDSNPWFLSLLHKLLLGDKDVLHLMGENPFHDSPPKFIRTQLFLYHYTMNTSTLGDIMFRGSSNTTAAWWTRKYVRDYTPFVVSNDSFSALENILVRYGVYRRDFKPEAASGLLHSLILSLRKGHRNIAPQNLISTLLFLTVTLLIFKVWWRKMGKKLCTPTLTKLKDKCEPAAESIFKRTENVVQKCKSFTCQTPMGRCFLLFVDMFSETYKGMCLMLTDYWNRGRSSVWMRAKTKSKALRPPLKKNA